jgi:membrane protein
MPSETKHSRTRSRNSLWKVRGFSLRQLQRGVVHEIRVKNFVGKASELAFDFLFALFPLILFMLTLFGIFASHSFELQTNFLLYFADFLPPIAFALLKRITVELAADASGGKLTFGIVTALWFASGGVSSMISAVNLTRRVSETRSWLKVRIIAIGLTLAMSILMLAALTLVLAGGRFLNWFGALIGLEPIVLTVWRIAQWPAAIVFVLMSYSLIYFFGTDAKERRWHWITPGSAFGALVWLLGSIGFRVYLHYFNSYSASYGSLGAVMILLAWLYISGLAFLVGTEINAQIEQAIAADLARQSSLAN